MAEKPKLTVHTTPTRAPRTGVRGAYDQLSHRARRNLAIGATVAAPGLLIGSALIHDAVDGSSHRQNQQIVNMERAKAKAAKAAERMVGSVALTDQSKIEHLPSGMGEDYIIDQTSPGLADPITRAALTKYIDKQAPGGMLQAGEAYHAPHIDAQTLKPVIPEGPEGQPPQNP